MKLATRTLAVSLVAAGCGSLDLNTCCVAAASLPQFTTVHIIGVSVALHGEPFRDDTAMAERLQREFTREFPDVRFVSEGGDIGLILTVVDYVPGCAPNCGNFPTYRNWSGTVTTWIPKPGTNMMFGSQIVDIKVTTYNPLADPAARFAREFKKYWTSARTPPAQP